MHQIQFKSMAQVEQVIPKTLQISAGKPPAVQSLLRRFWAIQSPSQAQNIASSEIIIPIDCTTASCFLDPHQSYLTFQLEILNTNPFIDYANFGPAGAASVIEKLQIKSQGTVIEEIQDYATMFELALNREGANMEEFSMYVSRYNGIKSGWVWGDSDNLNKVKPPMVDRSGLIMYACTPDNFGKPHGWQSPHLVPYYAAPTVSGTTSISLPVVNNNTYERGWFVADGHNYYYMADGTNPNTWPDTLGREPPLYISETQINAASSKRLQDYFTFLSNVKCIPIGCKSTIYRDPLTGIYTPNGATNSTSYETSSSYSSGRYIHQVTLPIMSGIIGLQADKCFPTFICQDLSLVLTLSTAMKAAYYTMDPCRRIVGTRRDYVVWKGQALGGICYNYSAGTQALLGRIKIPDLETDCSGGDQPIPQNNNFVDCITTSPLDGSITQTNFNPLGAYGLLSQYALVSNYLNGSAGSYNAMNDTLSGQGANTTTTYVYGTVGSENRTWNYYWSNQPNLGMAQGVPVFSQADVQYNSEYPAFPFAGYWATANWNQDDTPTNAPSDPVMRMTAIKNAITLAPTVGTTSTISGTTAGCPTWMNSMMPTWTSYLFQAKMPQYFIPSIYQYHADPATGCTYTSSIAYAVDNDEYVAATAGTGSNAFEPNGGVGVNIAALSTGSSSLCVYNTGLAYTANCMPVNQYVDFKGSTPFSAVGVGYQGIPNIGNEGMGCFGTFLSASRPQTKRCFYNYRQPNVSGNLTDVNNSNITYPRYFGGGNNNTTSGQGAYPTMLVSNVAFVCQQILVPDAIARQIVAMSAMGNIAIQSKSMKVFTNLTNSLNSTTQNIIVPVRVGLANSLIFLFRSQDQMANNDKQGMLHSLSGFNPFGSITYAPDSVSYSGTDSVPTVVPMALAPNVQLPTSSAWSCQLQIGSDYVPNQSITTPAELIFEVEKETHDLFQLRSRPLGGLIHALAKPQTITTIGSSFTVPTGVWGGGSKNLIGAIDPQAWSNNDDNYGAGYGYPNLLATSHTSSFGVQYWGQGYKTDATGNQMGALSSYDQPASKFTYGSCTTNGDILPTEIDIMTTDTFWTVYQDPDYLLDQTLTNNSNFRHMTNYQNIPEPTLDKWVPVKLGQYHINDFIAPKGKFYLPFELESFSGISNVASSGRYLGNNQVSLLLQGAAMFAAMTVNVTAVVLAQTTISIEAGGTVRMFM